MAFLPATFRGEQPATKVSIPSWLSRKVTPLLEGLAQISSTRPIYTVALVASIASVSYIGLLEDSKFASHRTGEPAQWSLLEKSSHNLTTSLHNAWTWQAFEPSIEIPNDAYHFALFTLKFPETSLADEDINVVNLETASQIDLTASYPTLLMVNSTKGDNNSTRVVTVPFNQGPSFISGLQHATGSDPGVHTFNVSSKPTGNWIMTVEGAQDRSSLAALIWDSWMDFSALFQQAQSLDIAIMVLGYIAMYVTLASLVQSMQRMGSHFWLAANVLFSSLFAFLLGLFVTHACGVQVSKIAISEGLPFLVVIVGFEKNIVLTRSVLSHALERLKPDNSANGESRKDKHSSRKPTDFAKAAVKSAIHEHGYEVAKAYAIEIVVSVFGACSGVKGGLQQFCFFAAWVLFFDCVLLFSFYTAVLCVKLEVTRIRRYNELRKVLEDDGIDDRVAQEVAESSDWPKADGNGLPGRTIFGKEIKSRHVHNYKVVMVSSFLLINAYNLYTVQVRGAKSIFDFSSWPSSFDTESPLASFHPTPATSDVLDTILLTARQNNQETLVTILPPVEYRPFVSHHTNTSSPGDTFSQLIGANVGGQVVGGLLKSLEDPILSKWIVAALALSVALNGYLFNAATAGIEERPRREIDRKDLARAQDFNISENTTTIANEPNSAQSEAPPTPPLTDDEGADKGSKLDADDTKSVSPCPKRSQEQMEEVLAKDQAKALTDEEVISLSLQGKIPGYALEKKLGDFTRAVKVRRATIARNKATSELTRSLEYSKLPYRGYNWNKVFGACCENVVGYMPLPVGVAGPLVVDGQSYFIPMATTEGVLVASTSRGCKAINFGGGAVTVVTDDGMTRGPCVSFQNLERAGAAKLWLDSEAGQRTIKSAFNSTSRFARLETLKTVVAGTKLYIRFKTTTGDAMGMNMISKGVEHALTAMMDEGFEDMNVVSLSGNYCADKKATAVNWIEGRGKSVVAEAIIPGEAIKSILKTDVDSLVELNVSKNLIGSAMAGAAGGFNAHAANIVAAVFIATGQDPAQVVESANCITTMEKYVNLLI